ncbi:MAG: hypothetical protein FWF53_11155 [Candidatus Azobacteroides sp.]|nr:hypothetical protein [Candidatus Azobacteroides sp.]
MNRLEQYIRDRKNLFEEEPAAGHFERLQQKMNRQSRRVAVLRWSISIAASVAIVFFVGILWRHAGKQDNRIVMCENTIDMKDCYLNKMNVVAGRIEVLTKDLDPWDRQQVMSDVQNIIDIAGSGFEHEIPEELPVKETKLILAAYYRQNLKSLETIEEDLKIMNYEL